MTGVFVEKKIDSIKVILLSVTTTDSHTRDCELSLEIDNKYPVTNREVRKEWSIRLILINFTQIFM